MKNISRAAIILALFFVHVAYGQAPKPTTTGPTLLTADSLASGNYKNILSSFYQLAFTDLTGPNKELKFTTNPYAIMLRHDSTVAEDQKFQKLRAWRNLNFTVDAKLDSSNNFNGFSVGVTYALWNARDVTISKAFGKLLADDPNDNEYAALLVAAATSIITTYAGDLPTRDLLLIQEKTAARDSTLTFDKLDSRLQTILRNLIDQDTVTYALVKKALAANPKLSVFSERNKGYQQLIKEFQNKPLWTVGITDTSYKTGLFTKSLQLTTEYTQGTLDTSVSSVNLEVDIKGSLSFVDDTLQTGMNLNRQVFNFTPGVNLVVKGRQTKQPYLEFKLSGSYINIWHGLLYKNENQITNTLNGQLSLRIYKDIWVPLQISYDTKTHNVFGFLNVTTNFQALGGLFKSGNSVNTKS